MPSAPVTKPPSKWWWIPCKGEVGCWLLYEDDKCRGYYNLLIDSFQELKDGKWLAPQPGLPPGFKPPPVEKIGPPRLGARIADV